MQTVKFKHNIKLEELQVKVVGRVKYDQILNKIQHQVI